MYEGWKVRGLAAARSGEGLDAPHVHARVVSRRRINWAAWDAFAEKSGGSIKGAYHHIRAWGARRWLRYRVVLLEIGVDAEGETQKIGQCAVAIGRNGPNRFLDGLHLAPGCEPLWDQAMAAVLRETGAGAYDYGGIWRLEAPRDRVLEAIDGVSVETVRPLVVQAVDFGRWESWDEYYRDVVPNVRRAATAAPRRYPGLDLAMRKGRAALASLPDLSRLRMAVAARKGLAERPLGFLLSKLALTLTCSRYMISGVAHVGGMALGAFYGARFGDNTYYLEGASAAQNTGASWRLLFAVMEEAFTRAPGGKFVMGYVDFATHDEAQGGGLLRSRRACRVSDFPTSMVRFRYAG